MENNFKAQYANLGITAPKTKDLVKKAQIIYEAACKKLELDPNGQPDLSEVRTKYHASQRALHKLQVIRDAITGDREADWNNSNEQKWFGWYWLNAPGFRFYGAYYHCTTSCVGSRLCTFCEEDQKFFSTQCIALWSDYYGVALPVASKKK
jgi:hypothetical protein